TQSKSDKNSIDNEVSLDFLKNLPTADTLDFVLNLIYGKFKKLFSVFSSIEPSLRINNLDKYESLVNDIQDSIKKNDFETFMKIYPQLTQYHKFLLADVNSIIKDLSLIKKGYEDFTGLKLINSDFTGFNESRNNFLFIVDSFKKICFVNSISDVIKSMESIADGCKKLKPDILRSSDLLDYMYSNTFIKKDEMIDLKNAVGKLFPTMVSNEDEIFVGNVKNIVTAYINNGLSIMGYKYNSRWKGIDFLNDVKLKNIDFISIANILNSILAELEIKNQNNLNNFLKKLSTTLFLMLEQNTYGDLETLYRLLEAKDGDFLKKFSDYNDLQGCFTNYLNTTKQKFTISKSLTTKNDFNDFNSYINENNYLTNLGLVKTSSVDLIKSINFTDFSSDSPQEFVKYIKIFYFNQYAINLNIPSVQKISFKFSKINDITNFLNSFINGLNTEITS
ncbi:MAG: hypothetical protein ACK5XN_08105, partial [Bacteroidota bacterium]